MKKEKTVNVMMEKEQHEELREASYRERKSMAEIVREALAFYLADKFQAVTK